jgi:TPR repeat protein
MRQSSRTVSGAAGILLLGLAVFGFMQRSPDLSNLPTEQIERLRLKAQAAPQTDALAQIRLAADQGNRSARRVAAFLYLNKTDYASWQTGLEYARLAAKQGDPEAFYLLGQANFNGHATLTQMPDYGRARHWFELAAEHGSGKAQYFLGLIYKNGYGVAADPQTASNWFQQSVDHGNADAMFMLGNAYAHGDGVKPDVKRARKLYQAAASLEHPLASQTLAFALQQGELGFARNQDQADEMMLETEHQIEDMKAATP